MAYALATRRSKTPKFDNMTRTNWGRQDALADRRAGRRMKDELWLSRHFDKHYAAGYSEGKQAQ